MFRVGMTPKLRLKNIFLVPAGSKVTVKFLIASDDNISVRKVEIDTILPNYYVAPTSASQEDVRKLVDEEEKINIRATPIGPDAVSVWCDVKDVIIIPNQRPKK